jgi:hypothetical protein
MLTVTTHESRFVAPKCMCLRVLYAPLFITRYATSEKRQVVLMPYDSSVNVPSGAPCKLKRDLCALQAGLRLQGDGHAARNTDAR